MRPKAACGGTIRVGQANMRRFPLIVLAPAAAMVAAACETDLTPTIARIGATTPTLLTTRPESLVVAPQFVQLVTGTPFQLATNAPDTLRKQLVWFSQIPSIATVSQTGLVTAGTPGTTIVTVRYSFDTTNQSSTAIQVLGPVR
jgi:hypothetical protein